MKKMFLTALCIFVAYIAGAQTLPSVKLKDINGKEVNTAELSNNGKPIILNFWATWCKPCLKEMKAIGDVYADWVEETGVKMVSVSIDDARSAPKVKTLADASGWEYEILLDVNGDFKRAMNVANPPHVFILDGEGKVVFQHNGYSEGSEEELIDIVRRLNAGEKIEQK